MKEALKLAREHIAGNYTVSAEEALAAIDKALAQPEQEPALQVEQEPFQYGAVLEKIFTEAEKLFEEGIYDGRYINWHKALEEASKKYPAPQRTWVGLTEAEANNIYKGASTFGEMMRMVEAKLKELNT